MLKKYFDKVYCINLDIRSERWDITKNQLDQLDIECERFHAVDGQTLDISCKKLSKSEIGCFLSHLNIIKEAKKLNLNNILILEDDVVFDFNFKEKFPIFMEQVPENWDMLFIGAIPAFGKQTIPITDNIHRVVEVYGLQCVAIKNTLFDIIIEEADVAKLDIPIDIYYLDLMKRFNIYAFVPSLAIQLQGYSNNRDRHVGYNFI